MHFKSTQQKKYISKKFKKMVSDQNGYVSKRVCVVGAGPSGLVAARELKKEGHDVIVLEQKQEIGGQWLYDPNVEDEDPLGKGLIRKVHSGVYASLRVFAPREAMGFPDFPFVVKEGGDCRRHPGHSEYLEYLKDFCEVFGLRDFIRFNTRVEYVGMLNYEGNNGDDIKDLKWIVRSVNLKKQTRKRDDGDEKAAAAVAAEELFDAVVVANGHYCQPYLSPIKGMEDWKRKQMHSHVYRTPDPFKNEVVVVVGNSQSGQDISMELTKMAKEVHFSAKDKSVTEGLLKVISKCSNLHLHPVIDSMYEDGRVVFIDGNSIIADTIIYATGYSYSFPFLDTKGIVKVNDNRVEPLYEHTFPPLLAPSLSFIGIPKMVLLPFFELQAKWIAQVLSGKKKLPSFEQMMISAQEFYHSRDLSSIPKHYTHAIIPYDGFEYCDKYADFSDSPHLEDWKKELVLYSASKYFTDLENFRDSNDHDHKMLQLAQQIYNYTKV
ncbi:OLC1v1012339C1 [Oldenlandia corymbosa var. corymbosa]|uniref:Flavin-containing monooxygenase n=1 Tax=Oldenlandia corymbosa var. corymbosa TaxID=529605 RepID=A0AAV1DVQ5_OLDCO|nr:OLC1v1012339C1 [Oldenlandia corymbosa var. corymbosa]